MAARHHLVPSLRLESPRDISDALVALHSSDPATVFLSVAGRMKRPSIQAIEAVLYDDRSLLRHHAMRRTLWVMSPEVAELAHASSTRKVAAAERRTLVRRLAESGVVEEPEAWLDDALRRMVGAVEDAGRISTRALGELFPDLRLDLPYPGPKTTVVPIAAHTKVIQLAGFQGRVVRTRPAGSWVGSQYAWAPIQRWYALGLDHRHTDEAAAELLEKWLLRFGPGTETDIVWWTGWTKTLVRKALAAIDAEVVSLDDGRTGWVAADDPDDAPSPPWVALLPGLDPTPMGWKERSWFLADELVPEIFDRSGNVGPTIWVDGRVVGGWAQRTDGSIATKLLLDPGRPVETELAEEIERVRDFVGGARFTPRFPTPTDKALARASA